MTEQSITRRLSQHFDYQKNAVLANYAAGTTGWEADLIVVRPSGWAMEVEVKISVSDFRAEFKNKAKKHRVLAEGRPKTIIRPYGWNDTNLADWKEALSHPLCEPLTCRSDGDPHSIEDWRNCDPHRCKHYWFAMPLDLAQKLAPEIPAHAGLIGIHECRFNNGRVEILKDAPKLEHCRKVTERERSHIFECAYHRFWQFERGCRTVPKEQVA